MYFIGVDLGWKDKKTTGICVLDEGSKIKSIRVVEGTRLFTALKPYLPKASITAIDAPLGSAGATASYTFLYIITGRNHIGKPSRRFGDAKIVSATDFFYLI